ncbi:MAG: YcjF family protein [cyanobacterium endosymbiont of Rhopalodia sterrenbergii]
MGKKFNKPILVAGVGISFILWFYKSFSQQILEVGEWGLLSAISLGLGFWWRQGQKEMTNKPLPVTRLTEQSVRDVITQGELILNTLATEAPDCDISNFKQQLTQLSLGFDRQELTIALAGGKKVGKTTLKKILLAQDFSDEISLIEIESLFKETKMPEIKADLILLLITGDLTNSHWRFLQKCNQHHQRFILVFNKKDQYIPEERVLILEQVRQQLKLMIAPSDVIAISAAPQALKVRQHEENGIIREWTESQLPEIHSLSDRLKLVLELERKMLVWGSLWREAVSLRQQAKANLDSIRRDCALPIIEKYQWIAAASAFANPIAALDLLATAAISSQLVIDLGRIYQQKLSFSQGQALSGTIGKLIVKLGLVELSTQTIGSFLKNNTITYIAGGTVQAISAAYLTRLAGLSLVEHFQDQDIDSSAIEEIDLTKLPQKIRQVFEKNKRTALVNNFIQQALPHLSNQP